MKKYVFTLLLIPFLSLSCKQQDRASEPQTIEKEKPVVYVTNYPLYYFTDQLGGEYLNLRFPAREEFDPSVWSPPADTIAVMQQADLVLLNGASYESWLMNVSLPDSILTDTSAEFRDNLLSGGQTFTHSHGEEGEHAHESTASTTWLDLNKAKAQSNAVTVALIDLLPEHRQTIIQRNDSLTGQLDALHAEYIDLTKEGEHAVIAFSHPVYQYLQHAYDLHGESLHWEPDTPLNHDHMHELEHLSEGKKIQFLAWEAEPLQENREMLKKEGIESVVLAPLGGWPAQGDLMDGYKQNLETLKKVISGK